MPQLDAGVIFAIITVRLFGALLKPLKEWVWLNLFLRGEIDFPTNNEKRQSKEWVSPENLPQEKSRDLSERDSINWKISCELH